MRDVESAELLLRQDTLADFIYETRSYDEACDKAKHLLEAIAAERTPQAGGMPGREAIARALFARRYRMNPKDVEGMFKWYADNTHGIDKTRVAIHSTFLDADAVLALVQPLQVGRDAVETWNHIEWLLIEECGLRSDEGIQHQRSNCINAIKNGMPDKALIEAAVEFLGTGEGLHKIRVNGAMMDRKQLAAELRKVPPSRPTPSEGG